MLTHDAVRRVSNLLWYEGVFYRAMKPVNMLMWHFLIRHLKYKTWCHLWGGNLGWQYVEVEGLVQLQSQLWINNWPFFFKSHMVKVTFEKQIIRKRVERKPSSTFSSFFSLLLDDRFLISFQINLAPAFQWKSRIYRRILGDGAFLFSRLLC